ncbi:aspartate/glutamate racemase family protein [Vibrio fluvialis]|uniref:aspartate/glutamate racemase family protein n=1 Tax=Vibrio fluvialis TaxID=676 RepID=UPI000645D473|nr:aspartate/glutamate racemase family protein [Vibrio fluvialis]HDM8035303.1 aspartate/glutamate racemase family protein [Vibrio fluvialis clinical-1]EKO3396393.1 aspartate/glutamate racemase family protein [Vibrio fluvialis]EKO3413173.1 aspartate/glutamate racemase family protein [Vibrio fluvialis]EKO3434995.1 aspartate/glutamate racemase family protein [Vibrio fluvialis]EKO3437027.1 aspartate/glutamate racemase family protein [Vibrio fluvialis]
MKTIGMIGGMSWESTLSYYKAINEGVKAALGGLNSAQICLYSVNFEPIEKLQHEGKWDETAQLLAQAAKSVEAGGADFLLICTNTMHKVAPEIEAQISIPILHIADATAKQLQQDGIKRVGLLGTRFTMEQEFYKGRLQQQFGIDVLIPDAEQRQQVHRVIYEELCLGTIRPESRAQYVEIVEDLHRRGAQAVILGCTEIALLIQQHDTDVPLYDTTKIHAEQAVQLALT